MCEGCWELGRARIVVRHWGALVNRGNFLSPLWGLVHFPLANPQLALWAAFFRRFAACIAVKSPLAVGTEDFSALPCFRDENDSQSACETRLLRPLASARQCPRIP